MADENPDGCHAEASQALRDVLTAVAARVAAAEVRLNAAEQELARYAQGQLMARASLLIVEHPRVAAFGYSTHRTFSDPDLRPENPRCERRAIVQMRPASATDETAKADAEHAVGALLDDADPALLARLFDAKPGETATLTRETLTQRACVIAAAWRTATPHAP